MDKPELKVSNRADIAQYTDVSGDSMGITIYSNGETVIEVRNDNKSHSVLLTNKAAHQLRDMLNRRFPNATAVQ